MHYNSTQESCLNKAFFYEDFFIDLKLLKTTKMGVFCSKKQSWCRPWLAWPKSNFGGGVTQHLTSVKKHHEKERDVTTIPNSHNRFYLGVSHRARTTFAFSFVLYLYSIVKFQSVHSINVYVQLYILYL